MLGDQKKTTGSHIKTTHTPRRPKEPTSGPLTMIGCRQDTSERPNSNSYPNRNRLHAIQRLRATWETANTPYGLRQEHTRSRLTTDSRDDKTGSTGSTETNRNTHRGHTALARPSPRAHKVKTHNRLTRRQNRVHETNEITR